MPQVTSALFQITLLAFLTNLIYFGINFWLYKLLPSTANFLLVGKIFVFIWAVWAFFFLVAGLLSRITAGKVKKPVQLAEKQVFTSLEEIFCLDESLEAVLNEALTFLAAKGKFLKVAFFMLQEWRDFSRPSESTYLSKEETFFVPKGTVQNFGFMAGFGVGKELKDLKLASDFPLINFFETYKKPLSFKEIQETRQHNLPAELREELKTRLKIFGINFCWPVFEVGKLEGVLFLKTRLDSQKPEEGLMDEFCRLLIEKLKVDQRHESEMAEGEKFFLLSGEVSKAHKEIEKKQRQIELLEAKEKDLEIQLTGFEEKAKEVAGLKEKLEKIEAETKGARLPPDFSKDELTQLKKEKEEFSAKLEKLLEANRSLVASTANFSSVSRELYEANKHEREVKNYLESLLERMSNGVAGINTEGIIVTYNRQMAAITGLPEEEMLEKGYSVFLKKIFEEPDKISGFLKTAFIEGKSFLKYETKIHKTTGGEVPVNLAVVPLRGLEKEVLGVMMIVTDLTESKKLELESKKRSRLESIQQMTVSLNHEINNPLTSVLCNVQFVLKKIKEEGGLPDAGELLESLSIAEKESKRIKKILENLRKVNEPTTTEYLPGVEMIDISGSIKDEEIS